jgi:hypothetical protein
LINLELADYILLFAAIFETYLFGIVSIIVAGIHSTGYKNWVYAS